MLVDIVVIRSLHGLHACVTVLRHGLFRKEEHIHGTRWVFYCKMLCSLFSFPMRKLVSLAEFLKWFLVLKKKTKQGICFVYFHPASACVMKHGFIGNLGTQWNVCSLSPVSNGTLDLLSASQRTYQCGNMLREALFLRTIGKCWLVIICC
jgi:hypothetical protein